MDKGVAYEELIAAVGMEASAMRHRQGPIL